MRLGAWGFIAVGAGVLASLALGLAFARVEHLERRELMLESPFIALADLLREPHASKVSVRLLEVQLGQGESVLFELCAKDELKAPHFEDAFALAVLRWPAEGTAGKPELMLRVPLDREHLAQAKRADGVACLPLGGGRIEHAGRHTLEVAFADKPLGDAVKSVPVQGRVLARSPLARVDRGALLVLVGAVLALLLALFALPRSHLDGLEPEPSELHGMQVGTTAAALVALGLLASSTYLPLYGSALGFVKGAMIFALQTVAALALSGLWSAPRRTSLGLTRPPRALLWLAAAPVAALVLAACARIALRVTPSTGEAPVESFISWPSGMLAFATMGVIAPLAEELFFRGYLFRVVLPLGKLAACAITLVLFVALHLAQSWGNWGGVLAVALTGAVLTWLRAASNSLLPCTLAHVLYNATLSLQAF
jgi:membrane protease YdiL (CAAX protease family)